VRVVRSVSVRSVSVRSVCLCVSCVSAMLGGCTNRVRGCKKVIRARLVCSVALSNVIKNVLDDM
jgi:hypothetical protein